jgi:hypothetical protein
LTNKLEGILNYLEIGENCIPKRCAFEHWTGTKKELEKTKINLEETRTNVKNLSTQLNGNFIFILEN